jgi:peptide subunit release factor 1 (eRF1)
LLTAYLNTTPAEASHHNPVPSYLAWLKKVANSIGDNLPPNERGPFREQLHRVEEFLHDRAPAEKSLVILAGPKTWETVSLQVEIANELHWAKPAISQLLWLAAEHRPYCILVVDRGGARFFSYRLREMTLLQETKFDVDISQWKKEDLGHVARPGVQMTYGSQRDVFEHRMDAQYSRLCREIAEKAIHLREIERFAAAFLVGSQRLTAPIAAEFPRELQQRVRLIKKDLGKFGPHELQEHVDPEIEEWEREHETMLVNELLSSERGAVVGIDETLAQLQKRKIRTLVLFRDLDARLHRCTNCGWTDSSADPVCSVCQGDRYVITLRDVLPDLAAASEADVEVVSDKAALRLKEAGGIGAWLRQPKQSGLSQAVARAR